MSNPQHIFEAVAKARNGLEDVRPVGSHTAVNYERKAVRLLRFVLERRKTDKDCWKNALLPYADKANSFFAMRAAVVWALRDWIRRQLEVWDTCVATSDTPGQLRAGASIERFSKDIDEVNAVKRADLLSASGRQPKRVQSKKSDLNKLPMDWRQRVLSHCGQGERAALTWLLTVTGCRPAEVVKGVELRFEDGRVRARIMGAKVTTRSGQSWREMEIACDWIPSDLLQMLRAKRTHTVSIGSTSKLRYLVAAVGKAALESKIRLCPYHFRHQLAQDMRGTGWKSEEIGAALGQLVSETSSIYGKRRRKGQGGRSVEPQVVRGSVKTASPVRPRSAFDPASLPAAKALQRKKGPKL